MFPERKSITGGTGMVYEAIAKLVQYGIDAGLIQEVDRIYAVNRILEQMQMDEYEEPQAGAGGRPYYADLEAIPASTSS